MSAATPPDPEPANHAIGDAECEEPFLERARLEAGSDQNRDPAKPFTLCVQRLDAAARHARLLRRILEPDDGDLLLRNQGQHTVVLQDHHLGGRGAAREFAMFRQVDLIRADPGVWILFGGQFAGQCAGQ